MVPTLALLFAALAGSLPPRDMVPPPGVAQAASLPPTLGLDGDYRVDGNMAMQIQQVALRKLQLASCMFFQVLNVIAPVLPALLPTML